MLFRITNSLRAEVFVNDEIGEARVFNYLSGAIYRAEELGERLGTNL